MQGASFASRDAVLTELDARLASSPSSGLEVAEQLFRVVDALDGSGSLRRVLADPARGGHDKAALMAQLFPSLSEIAHDAVAAAVGKRWSTDADLAEVLEDAAEHALIVFADDAGTLGHVEEELFRVERQVTAERELRVALNNRSATPEQRTALFEATVGKGLKPTTHALLTRAVAVPRGRRLVAAIEDYLDQAAARRGRIVARVTAAVEPSAAQRQRLTEILSRAYDRDIQLNVALDPKVLGGIKVQVGSEVVDGTVLARLDHARRRLVG